MKNNFLKIIFIIFLIGLIIGAIYLTFFKNKEIGQAQSFISQTSKGTTISNHIRIGIIEFDNMNPILSNNKNVQDVSRLIFDPLFTLTEDYKLEKALATEWSKLDSKTYLIKLRENVKWQDGNKFDSSDVIFTIDMLKELGKNSVYYYNIENISKLEEVDEYTLKIEIDKEIPYFEYNLIFPIVSSKYFDAENFKAESKNLKPAGTGKFYISDVSNDSILLKRNVSGWDNQELKLDSISLQFCDSLSSAINCFKAGEIDIFTTSNYKIEEYLKNTSHSKQEYINRNYDYLILNCNHKVLENQEVRQSINSAINKEDIINDVYYKKYRQSNFPLDFGSYVYSNYSTIEYNKNTAKNLLMDKGWKYSSKKWRKTVNHKYLAIELDLLVNKDNSNLVKVANKIKDQLESVGIKIKVDEKATKQYNSALDKKQYDMVLTSSTYSYSPSLNKYFKEGNLANYKNEDLNKLLEEVQNSTEENEVKQKYGEIVEIYNDDVPYVSLYYNTNTMIYSNHLKGSIKPNSYNLFYGIESWYREYKK